MFQQAIEYNVQVVNILFRVFNLEIMNKQIIDEKDRSIQNLQGALEKEQKLKAELQDRNNENNKILAELQATKQKINNMEMHSNNLENIRIKRDSLHATLKETNVN